MPVVSPTALAAPTAPTASPADMSAPAPTTRFASFIYVSSRCPNNGGRLNSEQEKSFKLRHGFKVRPPTCFQPVLAHPLVQSIPFDRPDAGAVGCAPALRPEFRIGESMNGPVTGGEGVLTAGLDDVARRKLPVDLADLVGVLRTPSFEQEPRV
jgi:hypothetical protein